MFEAPHRVLLRRAPQAAAMLFAAALNRLLAPRLSAAQRECLNERVVLIGLPEAGLDCRVRWAKERFVACTPYTPVDLAVRAWEVDYFQLLMREVDADALFFQRRLRLEGDIELGLAVKNMLDAVELPPRLVHGLAIVRSISR